MYPSAFYSLYHNTVYFCSLCRGCWMSKRLTICLWLGWSFCQPCQMTHRLPQCLRLLSSVYQSTIKSAFTIFPTDVSIFVFHVQGVSDYQSKIFTGYSTVQGRSSTLMWLPDLYSVYLPALYDFFVNGKLSEGICCVYVY